MNKLQVFGAPRPQQYYTLQEEKGDIPHSHMLKFIFVVLLSQFML